MTSFVLRCLAPQQVLGHSRNDRPGKDIRGQHRENHRLSKRYEEVSRDAGQQEHRSKYNANRKCGHEGRCRYLRCTVQYNSVQVLLRFRFAISIDVLDLDGGIIHQDADRQRDGGRDDKCASPTAEENENHKSGEARGNKSFSDYSADRTTNEYRLISQRRYLQLLWNSGLDLWQQGFDAGDYVER